MWVGMEGPQGPGNWEQAGKLTGKWQCWCACVCVWRRRGGEFAGEMDQGRESRAPEEPCQLQGAQPCQALSAQ